MLTVATKGMKGGHGGSEGNEGSYDAQWRNQVGARGALRPYLVY